jgi:O-antigen/teichoic acid export membrane protein
MTDINKQMAKGALWMVLFKLVERSIGLISTVILARLLLPADFGLIAIATSIIAIIELLGAFNFDIALIQNSQADRSHYDTAWTFNVLYGVFSAGLLIALSWPAADFYHDFRLQPIISSLALSSMVGGFENIGVVAFRKNMRFDQEFKYLLAKKLISFVVTLTCAWFLRSYWALIAGMLTGRTSGVAISYLAQSYRPRICLVARRELFRFSRWLIFNNVLFFLVHRAPDFVIGKLTGPAGLGIYSISYEISNLPTTELVAPINRAVFPGYSKIGGDLVALRKSFLDVTGMIAMLAVPAGIGLAAVANPLVAVMLGEKWTEAGSLIEILAFYGIIGALQTNIGSVFIAIGKPHLLTLTTFIYVAVLFPLMIIGTFKFSVTGAAWAFLITALINMPINIGITAYKLKLSVIGFINVVWRPLFASGLMFYLVRTTVDTLKHSSVQVHDSLILVIGMLAGVLVHIVALFILWVLSGKPNGAERELLDRVKQHMVKLL